MPSYSNGYIPEELLVVFARGANTVDGSWFHGLPAATYARHLALVEAARRRTGNTLRISDGWGAYRPYFAQVIARNVYGNGAAVPGTSSHGGIWEGRQTAAMDYSNWGAVYGWNRDAFAADCRSVGLSPNLIVPARGYPDEPWHVVDLNPWSAVPAFEGFSIFEEDDMTPEQAAQLAAAVENSAEARRMLAVILGAIDASGAEGKLWQTLSGIGENSAEARRMGGVILGAIEPAPSESRPAGSGDGVAVVDEGAVARAVADEQDRRARERLS